MQELGTKLKTLREERRWTLRKAGLEIGVSRQTVMTAERGRVSVAVLTKMLQAYQVPQREKLRMLTSFVETFASP